jgi:hypothetical protein
MSDYDDKCTDYYQQRHQRRTKEKQAKHTFSVQVEIADAVSTPLRPMHWQLSAGEKETVHMMQARLRLLLGMPRLPRLMLFEMLMLMLMMMMMMMMMLLMMMTATKLATRPPIATVTKAPAPQSRTCKSRE